MPLQSCSKQPWRGIGREGRAISLCLMRVAKNYSSIGSDISLVKGFVMKGSLWIVLALIIASFPVHASESERIDRLTIQVNDLNRRVADLEALLKNKNAGSKPVVAGDAWKDKRSWRKLQTGMGYDEVEALLGVPRKINGGDVTFWHYSSESWHSNATFLRGRLESWNEPD